MRPSPRFRLLLSCLLAAWLGRDGAAQSHIIDLRATVLENGNPASRIQIGTLRVSFGQAQIGGTYTVGFGTAYLWDWYDWRWVNVEVQRSVGGAAQTTARNGQRLPAIDPPFRTASGGDDDLPYFYDDFEVRKGELSNGTTIVDRDFFERIFLKTSDEPAPGCRSCESRVKYRTCLVARDLSAGANGPHEILVVSGFEWEFVHSVDASGRASATTAFVQELTPAEGKATIDAALATAAPAFPPITRGGSSFVARDVFTLLRCTQAVPAGKKVGMGVPDGWYAGAHFRGASGMDATDGGLFYHHPLGTQPSVRVSGLGADLTGAGTPAGMLNGANSVAIVDEHSSALLVGEVITPAAGAAFQTLDLHYVNVVGTQVTSDQVVYSAGPFAGTSSRGINAIATVPGSEGDAVFATAGFTPSISSVGYFDRTTMGVKELPIVPPLPPGTPNAIAVDRTGQTIYLALANGSSSGTVVSLPIQGGAPQIVTTVSVQPHAMDVDALLGNVYVGGAGGFGTLAGVEPFGRFQFSLPTTMSSVNALAYEPATHQIIVAGTAAIGSGIFRDNLSGTASRIQAPPVGGWGVPAGLALNPAPARYGKGYAGRYHVQWHQPSRVVGPNGGTRNLPTSGNSRFSLTLCTNGQEFAGVLFFSGGEAAAPIPILDGDLLIDPFLYAIVAIASTGDEAFVPIAIPPLTAPGEVHGQFVGFDGVGDVTSSALRIPVFF